LKPSRSLTAPIRGLSYHVRSWGDVSAPKLFMLHGWMDVGASFQFLVDELAGEWNVLAPDWRGFGRTQWCSDGYWYPDYLADLDALLDHFAPHDRVRLVGHSLGGNVVNLYAGVRPERVSHAVSLDGFGLPEETADLAPTKIIKWLDALIDPPGFTPYADMAAVADRLQKNNGRLSRDKAEFLARHWASELPDATAALVSDPKHKLPFPTVYRIEEIFAVWRRVAAPVLWVGARDSFVQRWLSRSGDPQSVLAARMSVLPDARFVMIEDAGHMLHHDQPAAVAAAIEPFLSS
jgi:pimeloyl-ACP methyl ester carboxylesterase